MKKYSDWEDSELDLDKFVNPGDEIDYEIFEHIGYALVGPHFDDGRFLQCGECDYERDGVDYYMTAEEVDGKYFYRGVLPDLAKTTRVRCVSHKIKEVERPLQVGDPVEVYDRGLLLLQQFAPAGSKPNNHGTVSEIWDDGKTILVEFPIGDDDPEEHSQVAPYPKNQVKLRS